MGWLMDGWMEGHIQECLWSRLLDFPVFSFCTLTSRLWWEAVTTVCHQQLVNFLYFASLRQVSGFVLQQLCKPFALTLTAAASLCPLPKTLVKGTVWILANESAPSLSSHLDYIIQMYLSCQCWTSHFQNVIYSQASVSSDDDKWPVTAKDSISGKTAVSCATQETLESTRTESSS